MLIETSFYFGISAVWFFMPRYGKLLINEYACWFPMFRYGKLTANEYTLTEESFFRPEFFKFPKFFIINLKKRYSLLSDFEYFVLTRLGIWLSFCCCLKGLISLSHPNQSSALCGRRGYKGFRGRVRCLLSLLLI